MAGSVVILYDSVSPSTSVPVNSIVLSTSSSALIICAVAIVTSLTALTVTVKDVSTVTPLEVPDKLITTIPF